VIDLQGDENANDYQHNFTDGLEDVPAGTTFAKPFFTYAPEKRDHWFTLI